MTTAPDTPQRLLLLEGAREIASSHLAEIQRLFKPGAKATLIVRTPNYPDRDFVLTDDEPREAIAALERRIAEGKST